jgi:hypothetical protein
MNGAHLFTEALDPLLLGVVAERAPPGVGTGVPIPLGGFENAGMSSARGVRVASAANPRFPQLGFSSVG